LKLEERLRNELTAAVKAKNEATVRTLRFVMAQVKDGEIEKRAPLTDEEIIQVLKRLVKQHQESIEAFQKAGREELVAQESEEKKLLEVYLPAQLSEGEIGKVVDEVLQAGDAPNFGAVMGKVMQRIGSQADGKMVAQIVSRKLKASTS
jgi:hypothetical protein